MSHHHKRPGTPDNSNIRAFWITMAVMAAIGLLWLAMFKMASHKHIPPSIEISLPLPIPEIIRDILPPDERTAEPEPELRGTVAEEPQEAAPSLPEPELIQPEWTKPHIGKPTISVRSRLRHKHSHAHSRAHKPPLDARKSTNTPVPAPTNEVIEMNPSAS